MDFLWVVLGATHCKNERKSNEVEKKKCCAMFKSSFFPKPSNPPFVLQSDTELQVNCAS